MKSYIKLIQNMKIPNQAQCIVRQKSLSFYNTKCKKTPMVSKDFCKNNEMIFNFQKKERLF